MYKNSTFIFMAERNMVTAVAVSVFVPLVLSMAFAGGEGKQSIVERQCLVLGAHDGSS